MFACFKTTIRNNIKSSMGDCEFIAIFASESDAKEYCEEYLATDFHHFVIKLIASNTPIILEALL